MNQQGLKFKLWVELRAESRITKLWQNEVDSDIEMEDNRNPWRTSYVICTLFTAIGDTNYKMENQVRECVQERGRC